MTKLTASLVVDLVDKTGAKTQAIIGNMSRLERAERDFMMADRGLRLSNRDRAMERVLMERETSLEQRRQNMAMWATRGVMVTAAAGIAAGKAYADFATLERRVNRIVINADKGAEAITPTISNLQKVANDTRSGFDTVVEGLETLVASGRTLDESLAFLPSVAMTAQASGAAMADVALSADAMSGSMKIGAKDMQAAFDILVAGGKAGKFELKDMSQYLPSLLPAFSALGYKGTEGLQKIVAMLQIVRNQAGSSGEAATYLGNVLQKIHSVETAKKFSDFGIDLTEVLDKARREGKDVLDVFLDITEVATKGDLSKLTRLFTDSEMQKGVRALITQRQELEQLNTSLKNVDGSALKDFNQIAEDSASKIARLTGLWDRFTTQVGAGVATVANPVLETVTNEIDAATARANAQAGMDEKTRNSQSNDYKKRYREANPDAWFFQINQAYMTSLERVGRGEIRSVFDDLTALERRKAAIDLYSERKAKPSTGRHNRDFLGISTGKIPVPEHRPDSADVDRKPNPYRFGTGREMIEDSQRKLDDSTAQADGSNSVRPGQRSDELQAIMARLDRLDRDSSEDRLTRASADSSSSLGFLFDKNFWLGQPRRDEPKSDERRVQPDVDVAGASVEPVRQSVNDQTELDGKRRQGASDKDKMENPYTVGTEKEMAGDSQRKLDGSTSQANDSNSVRPGQRSDELQAIMAHLDRLDRDSSEDRNTRAAADSSGSVGTLFDKRFWISQKADVRPEQGDNGSIVGDEKPTAQVSLPDADRRQQGEPVDGPQPRLPSPKAGALDFLFDKSFWIGRAAQPDFNARDHFGIGVKASESPQTTTSPSEAVPAAPVAGAAVPGMQDLLDTMRGWFTSEAQKEVSITGTPTVIAQPSGVQSVTVTNPMPAPQISTVVHVSVTTNASPQAVGQAVGDAIGQKVKAALDGVQADTEYAVG